MNVVMGERRTLFAVAVHVVLVAELVVGSVLALTPPRTAPESSRLYIAVVGDSYTAGMYNTVVWPTLLAERTGWSVANFALPDTGFVADGEGGHAFTYQVDRAQGTHPRIILIVGGLADTGLADTKRVSIGAIDAINKIKIDGQRAFVIGPTWYKTPVPASVRRVSEAVRKVTEESGVPYLDALDPPWLTTDQMRRDLSGPTDEGQSAIADKIAAWLRAEVAG
jgi:hypothetical protein